MYLNDMNMDYIKISELIKNTLPPKLYKTKRGDFIVENEIFNNLNISECIEYNLNFDITSSVNIKIVYRNLNGEEIQLEDIISGDNLTNDNLIISFSKTFNMRIMKMTTIRYGLII